MPDFDTPRIDPDALRRRLDDLLASQPAPPAPASGVWRARLRRLPVLGPLAWRLWGRLTGRRFKQHLLGEIERLSHLADRLERLHADLTAQGEAIARVERRQARLRERLDRAGVPQPSDLFEPWYRALEDACRGSADELGAHLAGYLPHIGHGPVLDLGCGRGEWLALLAERGIPAVGVDHNPAMLEAARAAGHQVVESDLLDYLHAAAPASYGAVTAFQVAEHLPLPSLLELFAAARRVLMPGGLLLLETPNPENLQVAAFTFWQDPTHQRPLPPPLLAYTAAHFGYTDITILRAHPWDAALRFADPGPAAQHLEKILFGPQDYALLARTPANA